MKNTTNREATEDDITMLKYFYDNYEDIERYASFKDIKEDLAARYPFILAAWSNHKIAKETFKRLLDSIQP